MVFLSKHANRGASLVEVLTAIAVSLLLLSLGMPRMQEVLHSVMLTAASNDLLSDLHAARSEALRRNRRVSLCKTADGAQCAGHGGWEQGWIIFHDENRNGTIDAGEEVIRRHEALDSQLRLTGNQPLAKYISYNPLGASKLTGGGFQAGTMTLCRLSPDATPGRLVIVNALGRPRVQRVTVPYCG
jgi:type IV fimbrial biogenesis protein FimT